MKKTYLLFLLFNFLILRSFAQVSLEEGAVTNNPIDSRIEKMLGKDDKYFYLLKYYANSSGKNYLLEKYSIDNYKLEYSKSINVKDETNSVFLDAFYTCGKIVVFRQYADKKNDRKKLFMQSVDEEGVPSPQLLEIFDYSTARKYGLMLGSSKVKEGFVYDVDYTIDISENKKNIIAIASTSKAGETTEDKTFAKVIDMENLSVKIDQEIPDQYQTSKIVSWNYKVDNNANILFNFNYVNSTDNKTRIAIGLIGKNSTSIIGMDINVDRLKHKVEDIDFKIKENTIYCSVLYKNKIKEGDKTNLAPLFGVFEQTVDLTSFKTIKFDSVHFSKEISDKIATGKSFYYRTYRIASIEIAGDNIYTVIEQTSLVRGAFVVYKYTKGAGIDWVRAVPRNYDIHSERNNHYFIYSDGQQLYLVFGEAPSVLKKKTIDNLTMDNCEKTSYKKADVVAVSINEKGAMTKNLVYKKNNMILQFIELNTNIPYGYYSAPDFNLITPLKTNSAIVYFKGKGNKEYKFGKLTFK